MLPDRIAELRRGLIHIKESPEGPVLQQHRERVRAASAVVNRIVEDIDNGRRRPGMATELRNAWDNHQAIVFENPSVGRSVVIFNRVTVPFPPRRIDLFADLSA